VRAVRIEWPLALLALLIVPLAVLAYLALERRRARYAIHYTNIDVLASVAERSRPWRALVPPVLALLALICAVAALARPEVRVSVPSEQASIALVVDVSGSMSAEDVKPTRLGAAQEAVRRFLDRVPDKYRVGLITFSSEPFVASPLTHDRQLVRDGMQYGTTFGQGTAIGDALARSVELLQPVAADGDGSPSPSTSPGPPAPAAPDAPLSARWRRSKAQIARGRTASRSTRSLSALPPA
jgi:Ca-activated chloride channel family protein